MKTSIKAKIVIDVDNKNNPSKEVLTLTKIQDYVNKGEFKVEWINSDLDISAEPTLIIKIPYYYETF